jgi:hypothetical protein
MNEHHEKWVEGLMEWMKTVYAAYENGQLPERVFEEDSFQCKWCPIKKACWSDERVADVKIVKVRDLGYS